MRGCFHTLLPKPQKPEVPLKFLFTTGNLLHELCRTCWQQGVESDAVLALFTEGRCYKLKIRTGKIRDYKVEDHDPNPLHVKEHLELGKNLYSSSLGTRAHGMTFLCRTVLQP